jgi:DNA-binding NtrC family response regulator
MKTIPVDPVFVVDDDPETLKSVELLLYTIGINNILLCADSGEALRILEEKDVSLLLADLVMPGLSGEELLAKVKDQHPDLPVIIITGTHDIQTAVRCMKSGAYDFLLKPLQKEIFDSAVKRGLEYGSLLTEVRNLKKQVLAPALDHPEAFAKIITRDKKIEGIFRYIEAIAPGNEPVLITGESGVGKELFAHALYAASMRTGPSTSLKAGPSTWLRTGAFVPVNVAGLDDILFSDTLFGHRKGAYTGADETRKGLIEKAKGGILFLDEIGDLSVQSQVKLLRLIQEREYYPLGSDTPQTSEARIVVATNRGIKELAEGGNFRKDLFYRLSTHHIAIPPLRERREDIPLLIEHFVGEAALSLRKSDLVIREEVMSSLVLHDFPGNIRELRSVIFDAVSRAQGSHLTSDCFSIRLDTISGERNTEKPDLSQTGQILFPERLPTIKETADLLVREALRRSGGNQTNAARFLGITHQALSKRLKGL